MHFLSRAFLSKGHWSLLSVALVASALIFAGCDSGNNGDGPGGGGGPTLADRVSEQAELDSLNQLLEETNQTDVLRNRDLEFTVFAPSNAAFESYGFLFDRPEIATSVFENHRVVGDAVPADSLEDGDTFTAVGGDELQVQVDTVNGERSISVDGAPVTTADIEAPNGVIHVIDEVALPGNERLRATPSTASLSELVQSVGLGGNFNNLSNNWTTFAPENAAFETVASSSFTSGQLQQILQYHVLEGSVNADSLGQLLNQNNGEVSVPTLQGEDLTITERNDGTIAFNGGEATLDADRLNRQSTNGLFHLIDGLMLPPSFTRSVRYDLAANSNSGAIPSGVNATATFWEVDDNQTAVTLELENGITDTTLAHPAHIHNNNAEQGGGIEIFLTPIDGTRGGGTSARLVDRSLDELTSFNGYINIHQSVANLGEVVAQGNIGANAEGTLAAGLDLVDSRKSVEYDLAANANGGSAAPNGIPGTATFIELTDDMTFVQVSLDPSGGGATGAGVSHPAHIHNGSVGGGGGIEYPLGPVAGDDPNARSGKLVGESYNTLTGFDGHVKVHESLKALENVVSQGDVGAND